MKHLHCAKCGQELLFKRKAVPSIGRILDLVEPHECSKEIQMPKGAPIEIKPISEEKRNKIDELFGGFEFVQKLNKLPKGRTTGDSRKKEDVKDLSSSAPQTLINMVKKNG